jgi:hypothetical protein
MQIALTTYTICALVQQTRQLAHTGSVSVPPGSRDKLRYYR